MTDKKFIDMSANEKGEFLENNKHNDRPFTIAVGASREIYNCRHIKAVNKNSIVISTPTGEVVEEINNIVFMGKVTDDPMAPMRTKVMTLLDKVAEVEKHLHYGGFFYYSVNNEPTKIYNFNDFEKKVLCERLGILDNYRYLKPIADGFLFPVWIDGIHFTANGDITPVTEKNLALCSNLEFQVVEDIEPLMHSEEHYDKVISAPTEVSEKRFLEKKSELACKIMAELIECIPLSFNVTVVTESNKNTDLGTMSGYNSFPFAVQIDITWRDERSSDAYIETMIHELTRGYAHRMGFLRNTVSEKDLENIDEIYSSVSGALASNLWKNRSKIEKLMTKFMER